MKLPKVTIESDEARQGGRHGRWYDDACGAAFGMELVGERWSMLIVRELMFGGRRFGDLRKGLPGVSARVLTARLEGLEAAGIVTRRLLPPPAGVQIYELTAWGLAADEAMLALCRWSLRSSGHDHTLPLSPAAMMMSLRALFDRGAAGELALSCQIRIGGEHYAITVGDQTVTVVRGEVAAPAFVLSAPDTGPLKRLIYGKVPIGATEAMGLAFTGDHAALARFVDCFALPAKSA